MIEKEELAIKITITKDAESAACQIVDRVNEGFDAGRVNRQDVASWILTQFVESFSDKDIQQIRAAYFNEIALLESILKKAKHGGNLPPELKAALLSQVNMASDTTRKSKRVLTNKLTIGQLDESEAAT